MSILVGLLVFAAYSAVLASFLTVQVLTLPFDKWQGILNVASSWKLGIMMESAEFEMLFNTYNVSSYCEHLLLLSLRDIERQAAVF